MIRNARISDAKTITDIYNYYIKNSVATFEETPVEKIYFEERIGNALKKFPWFVFEEKGNVVGYAYAGPWKTRSGYIKTTEISVYLKNDIVQKGIGTQLYKKLIDDLKEKGFHVIIGGVSLPNKVSVRLHEKFGFEKIAHFKEVGFKFNKWVDVGYWQLTVNR